jgi:hypothetical protein
LYCGPARYGVKANRGSFANPKVRLAEGGTIGDLLEHPHWQTEERGITFINGELAAMPNVQSDLDHPLKDNDRVSFFDLQSMWPFQYGHGVPMMDEMTKAMQSSKVQRLHHAYK